MKNRIILLVEDNPDDELLTLRALRKNGIGDEVVVARNGAEALDYLFGTGTYAGRNTEVMPGLILLDLKLPGMDGLEVLGRLRSDERTRHLPVVVFTSYEEEYEAISGSGLHADGSIRKTVDFTDFSRAIGSLELSPRSTGETGSPTGRSAPRTASQPIRPTDGGVIDQITPSFTRSGDASHSPRLLRSGHARSASERSNRG